MFPDPLFLLQLLLIHFGADCTQPDGVGNTPLHMCVDNGHEDVSFFIYSIYQHLYMLLLSNIVTSAGLRYMILNHLQRLLKFIVWYTCKYCTSTMCIQHWKNHITFISVDF